MGYQFVAATLVYSINPSTGPFLGGTEVTVRGRNFVSVGIDEYSLLQCRFGQALALARFVNASTVICITPYHSFSRVPLEVSINGQDFSSNGLLFDFSSLEVTHMLPVRGPVSGGTNVVLDLDAKIDEIDFLCRFGDAALVLASRTSKGTQLQCRTPSHPAGVVPLTVFSRTDSTTLSTQFEFVWEPEVYSVTPDVALSSAMTPVFVHGAHFVNTSSLTCAFGSSRVNASFIDNSTAVCVAPFFSGLIESQHKVDVRISTNAQDFSLTKAPFEYVPCPIGSLCSHLQVHAASTGSSLA